MKREILYQRIGQKCGYPRLGDILAGRDSPENLPSDCLPWQGRKTLPRRRMKVTKSSKEGYINITHTMNKSYGIVMVDGKNLTVHRFVYETIYGLRDGDKLVNSCSNTLCVNPLHWRHINVSDEAAPEPPSEEPWTEEEVEQILDFYLIQHDTIDLRHPDIAMIPRDLLRKVLDYMGKGHLCPT
jgi:hypothetical protein